MLIGNFFNFRGFFESSIQPLNATNLHFKKDLLKLQAGTALLKFLCAARCF